MKIGLLVIGSEVLGGKISDANTKLLADFLKKNHLELKLSMVVRDEEKAIHQALRVLLDECDLLITSGGLGPTRDDLTKVTLASYLGRTISYSPEAEQVATKNYQKFEKTFPGKEHGYAYLPQGFIPLTNSSGYAPGFFAEHLGKFIFCAPGVPKEFKSMLDDHLIQLIFSKLDHAHFIETVLVRTKRVPEEKIFGEVDPGLWEKLSQFGEVSSLPVLFGVDIGVKLTAASQEELNEKKNKVLAIFHSSPIKESIWHVGPESLEELIIEMANRKKITFGFAESCTGGLCSHRVTGVSGSGNSFFGSIISYDEKVKMNLLSVKPETLQQHGAVSEETALEMALGLAQSLKVDVAISITGLAGPSGGTPEKPVGTVCIAYSNRGKTSAAKYRFFGDREQLKNRFAQAALHTLLEELEKFA
jgi:nicotinamide-nucleotide amidase